MKDEQNPDRWNHIKQDLKSALSSWEGPELGQQNTSSKDEKKLEEVKELLNVIKSKIKDLSKP